MAGSPFYVPILLGLGASELSMNVNSIARVRRIVRGIALEEAREMVVGLRSCKTVDGVEKAAREFIQARWSHLFDKEVLAGIKSPVIAS
jgi:phosphoenolpyruvate-protein kinase (PTS system EI component)